MNFPQRPPDVGSRRVRLALFVRTAGRAETSNQPRRLLQSFSQAMPSLSRSSPRLYRIGLEAIALSIISLGMVDAITMLPLAISATATNSASLRGPLLIVVAFGTGCFLLLAVSGRLARLPLLRRSRRLRAVAEHVHAHRARLGRRNAIVAGFYLLACWTTRAVGTSLLLSALGFAFSPTTALCVICLSAAAGVVPITAGGASRTSERPQASCSPSASARTWRSTSRSPPVCCWSPARALPRSGASSSRPRRSRSRGDGRRSPQAEPDHQRRPPPARDARQRTTAQTPIATAAREAPTMNVISPATASPLGNERARKRSDATELALAQGQASGRPNRPRSSLGAPLPARPLLTRRRLGA